MPTNSYRKPNNKVIQVFRGKELEPLIHSALEDTFHSLKMKISNHRAKYFIRSLRDSGFNGNAVIILEHSPLFSSQARGKIGNQIFRFFNKTSNQSVYPYKKPKNPRTKPQQNNRSKLSKANKAWHKLKPGQIANWNKKALHNPFSGYNLFISHFLKTH